MPTADPPQPAPVSLEDFNRRLTVLPGSVLTVILSEAIFGEDLGWFDFLNELFPLSHQSVNLNRESAHNNLRVDFYENAAFSCPI